MVIMVDRNCGFVNSALSIRGSPQSERLIGV